MKTITAGILVLTLASFLYSQDVQNQRTITVTGNSQIDVAPDEAIITFGIETEGENLRSAKNQNDLILKNLIDVLENYGVQQRDIQANYFSVEPMYDYYETQTLLGYYFRKTIVVTIRDMSKLDELIGLALEADVNYIHGIDFHTSRLLELKNEARVQALKAAKEKAELLARELGCQIGEAVYVYENQSSFWTWNTAYSWGMNWASNSTNYAYYGEDTNSDISPVAPGQVSVYSSISVSFEIR
ncbi:SIMPL domain-containing protein [candidate division WOR-3 bacterium]|nr:SIMPL domain-containing protein [candidate division WOR-3 bacterium]